MNLLRHQLLSAAVSLTSLSAYAADAPMPFAEAVFTEVINDVQVVHGGDAKAVKAEKNAKFRAPDLVRTGRKSRAQLTAADGTVARVGSNAVFSFDKDSRTMNLQSGSVLFHSPTGKGGGTIVTNSATASVIGTTIVVSATPDGGFKMLVLEGVAKVVYPNGQVATVNAGQMTFVMPGATVENKDGKSATAGAKAENGGEKSGGDRRGGSPGPVLNFDLGAVSESGLLNGFKSELASSGKIRFALREQRERIDEGELRTTGLPILGADSDDTIILGDPTVIQQAMQQFAANDQQRLLDVANRQLTIDGVTLIPSAALFLNAVEIPGTLRPTGTLPGGQFLQGVAAGDLVVNTSVLDLGFMQGRAHVDVLGFKTLQLGNVDFQTAPGATSLRIGGRQVLIQPGSTVNALLDGTVNTGSPTRFVVESFTSANYDGVVFGNATGDVQLRTMTGDLRMTGGSVDANTLLGHADFIAENGAVQLSGVSAMAGPSANLLGRTGVSLDSFTVSASHVEINASEGGVVISGGSNIDGFGARSVNIVGNGLAITGSTINTPGLATLNARSGTLAVTTSFVSADAVNATAANIHLVGFTQPPASSVIVGGELNARGGLLSLIAQNDLTLASRFYALGDAVTLSANRLDVAQSVIESTLANVSATVSDVRLDGGELVGAGFVNLDATGKVEILNGSALRAGTGAVNVGGATVSISGSNLQSTSLSTHVHAVGDLRVSGASSSFSGTGVDLLSDGGRVDIDVASIQLVGTSVTGATITGNGVLLDNGVVIAGGAGVALIDARTADLEITRANISANGVDLKGRDITLIGVGGSEDINGNITFGGEIYAGSRAFRVYGRGFTAGGYTKMTGNSAWVELTGDASLNLAAIESTTGVFDFTAVNLDLDQAELKSPNGLNLHLTGNLTQTSADMSAASAQVVVNAATVTLTNATITAGTDFILRTSGNQSWTGGVLVANNATFGGRDAAIPLQIDLTGVDVTTNKLAISAHTVAISNVRVTSPASFSVAEMTFRADSGQLNSPNFVPRTTQILAATSSYAVINGRVNIESLWVPLDGDMDVVAAGLVWSPEDNLGDPTKPVHILKFGVQDYRGETAKLDYARATDFNELSLTRFAPALPLSNVFRQSESASITPADFGLTGNESLPTIDGGGIHTIFDVQGVLARTIQLNGPVTVDLTSLNPAGAEVNARADIVATGGVSWNGTVTLHSDTLSHRRIEIRARTITAGSGSVLVSDLPYNPDAAGDSSALMLAAINNIESNGLPLSFNAIRNEAGAVEIGSALGDVTLTQTSVVAGFQSVDTSQSIPFAGPLQSGSVNLVTFTPGKTIRVVGGQLMGHASSYFDSGVMLDGDTVDIAAVSLRAESRSQVTAGSEPLYTSVAGGGTYSGQTDVTSGQYKSSGAIRIYGAALVKIQGGTISAADVQIGASPDAPVGSQLDSIEMNGTNFVMAASQALFDQQFNWIGSTGIAMEARTVNLKNIVFPDNVQVRLRSQDGVLNIVGAAGTMFGAVNFENVSIRTAGNANAPAGFVTPLSDAAGINSKVWIQGGQVYNNKVIDSTITGTGNASTAPIHIQSIGAAAQPGAHGAVSSF